MDAVYIAYLIAELRILSSWGATPKRLPSLPHLRMALGVSPEHAFGPAGRIMHRALLQTIRALPEQQYKLWGRTYSRTQVIIALQLEMGYDKTGSNAPTRRIRSMMALNLNYSAERWRREHGPRDELLAILAECLLPPQAIAA